MLQMLIVDDEADIRESLALYPWEEIGIEIAAVCQHGMEALQLAEERNLDLILTDIRMPIMDGLELVKRIRAHYPYIKMIVLSGHDDFAYAQTCIRYGVSEYLLKPVDPDQLLAAVDRLKGELQQEEEQDERARLLEQRSRTLVRSLRREFLERILSRPLTEDEIEDGCSLGEMMLEGGSYVAAILRLDQAAALRDAYRESDWSLMLFALNNIVTEIWEDEGLGYHYVDRHTGSCYLIATVRETLLQDIRQIQKQLYHFRGLFRSTISIVVGTPVASMAELYTSRQKAESRMTQLPGDSFETVVDFAPHLPSDPPPDGAGKPLSDSSLSMVNRAKQYIYQHFSQPLTLSEVAKAIHVNGSYLSHLFTEVTGSTYVHYLTACRMEKAKELLANPQLKVYEIGEMVGYQNPRYFSGIFRKFTGMTPNEYRAAKG